MAEKVDYKPLLLVEVPLPPAGENDGEDRETYDIARHVGAGMVDMAILAPSMIAGGPLLWWGAKALWNYLRTKPTEAGAEAPDQDFGGGERLVSMLLRSPALERLTFEQARHSDRRFPPGHPLPGRFYRQHPLASSRDDKLAVFIPLEMFDELLLKEREAELIRVLTDLGASEVTISESESSTSSASGSAKVGVAGGGGVEGGVNAGATSSDSNVRTFSFVGRPWSEDFEFDRSPFGWLDFEPSWDAIAYARVRGGCTEATLTLTRETSFSLGAELGVSGLMEHLAAVSAEASAERRKAAEHTVKVQFPGRAGASAEQ